MDDGIGYHVRPINRFQACGENADYAKWEDPELNCQLRACDLNFDNCGANEKENDEGNPEYCTTATHGQSSYALVAVALLESDSEYSHSFPLTTGFEIRYSWMTMASGADYGKSAFHSAS